MHSTEATNIRHLHINWPLSTAHQNQQSHTSTHTSQLAPCQCPPETALRDSIIAHCPLTQLQIQSSYNISTETHPAPWYLHFPFIPVSFHPYSLSIRHRNLNRPAVYHAVIPHILQTILHLRHPHSSISLLHPLTL